MKLDSKDYSSEQIKGAINVFTLIFSAILLFDMLLGVKVSEEKVEHRAYYKQQTGTIKNRSTKTIIGIITNKNEYPLRESSFYNISRIGDLIEIHKSKILGEVIKIRFKNIEYKDSAYSIYMFYYLFPVICITSSVCALIFYKFYRPYFDFFLVLSVILTIYLMISTFTNNIV